MKRVLTAAWVSLGALLGVTVGLLALLLLGTGVEQGVGGSPGWAAGTVLVTLGGPVVILGGLIVGAVAAYRLSVKRFMLSTMCAYVLALAGFAVIDDRRAKPELDAAGCSTSLKTATMLKDSVIEVYDRYCPTTPTHTVNASIAANVNFTEAGNILSIEPAHDARGHEVGGGIFVTGMGQAPNTVRVDYDSTARVVHRDTLVLGHPIRFEPFARDPLVGKKPRL